MGRRPKALEAKYYQGDWTFSGSVDSINNTVKLSIKDHRPSTTAVGIEVDEHELTILIFKLFELLINVRDRK